MKKYLIKALSLGLSITIGLIIVDVINKNEITFINILIRFIVIGIIDFFFSIVSNQIKLRKNK